MSYAAEFIHTTTWHQGRGLGLVLATDENIPHLCLGLTLVNGVSITRSEIIEYVLVAGLEYEELLP